MDEITSKSMFRYTWVLSDHHILIYFFFTQESETGLYICLNSFLGFGRDHVERHVAQTGNKVFLHLHKIKDLIPEDTTELEPEKKITRLAIGVEGGFQVDGTPKYEVQEKNSIAIFPGPTVIELPHPDLPLLVIFLLNIYLISQLLNIHVYNVG